MNSSLSANPPLAAPAPKTAPHQELIHFEDVSAGYNRRSPILTGVNFVLRSGDFLAIVGANGSGKSTLLRTLLGTLKPLAGRVTRGTDEGELHYGYVPQLQTLDATFPLTGFDVALMGRAGRLGALRRPGAIDRERTEFALEEVGAAGFAHKLYRDLSGGQKQRVLIARALAGDPHVLVLDEHTTGLDIPGERAIMALIDRLHEERHLAVVMVSHSINVVANHALSLGLITGGACRFAPVEEVVRPGFLTEFYGVPMTVVEAHGQHIIL